MWRARRAAVGSGAFDRATGFSGTTYTTGPNMTTLLGPKWAFTEVSALSGSRCPAEPRLVGVYALPEKGLRVRHIAGSFVYTTNRDQGGP